MRITELLRPSSDEQPSEPMSGSNGALSSREEVLRAIREHERFCLTTHERPDGDAVGSLAAMQQVLAALGKDAVAFMPARRVPAARTSTASSSSRGSPTEPPADLCRAHADLPGLRQHRPHAGRRAQARRRRRADHQHRPPPRQHALRDDQPRRPARVVHGRDGVGPDARRSACRVDAGDRRGAVRRPGDRHRPLHVREHRPAGARDGGRADRRAASTRTRSTGASTRASRRASSSCWRAGSTNVERFDGGLLTLTHLTRDDYRAAGADESYSEGVVDHLRSVEGTAVAGLVRDQLAGERGRARSRCARPTTASTSRRSPARAAAAATAARPASPPTSSSPSS